MSALVTGAAQGIGLAISKTLLRNAYKVALLDINSSVGVSTTENLKEEFGAEHVLFMQCDVTNEDQLASAYKRTVSTFGGLDVVCNNAGIGDEVNYKKTIAINLTSVIMSTRMAFDYMSTNKGGKGGVIVNIASAAGLFPEVGVPVYTATKQGVVGFSKALADCYLSDGIRVNCVCPAFTDTALFRSSLEIVGSGSYDDFISDLGVMSTDYVAEAVFKVIHDASMNGVLLMVRKRDGMNLVKLHVKKSAKL